MAGDWIKMRADLQTHPKIVRILSATGTDKFRVIGGLHAVWAVFDTHSEDGVLKGYTPELLDHVIGWPGLGRAMEAVGWLLFDGLETLALPDFEAHNGQSAKRRAEDQKRKKNSRQSVRNLSADDAEKKRTREEKRREDIKEPPVVPLGDTPAEVEQPKPKRANREAVTLDAYRAGGGKLIRGEDDPVWEYCETIGLPHDFVRLAGHEFLARFGGTKKLQADWPAHFRNAIRANWFRLWFQAGDGWELTTAGHQAKRMQREAS